VIPSTPERVKLFVGALLARDAEVEDARARCVSIFGPVDHESRPVPFTFTDYYDREMGPGLSRVFWSFARLIDPSAIVDAKHATNRIEEALARDGRRTVNLDPGYLDTYKVVLATAKGAGQKIYLRDGIWADLTVTFVKGRVNYYDWGFPDFKSGAYDRTLLRIREAYKAQRRSGVDGRPATR
jgi:hypothetical protein